MNVVDITHVKKKPCQISVRYTLLFLSSMFVVYVISKLKQKLLLFYYICPTNARYILTMPVP